MAPGRSDPPPSPNTSRLRPAHPPLLRHTATTLQQLDYQGVCVWPVSFSPASSMTTTHKKYRVEKRIRCCACPKVAGDVRRRIPQQGRPSGLLGQSSHATIIVHRSPPPGFLSTWGSFPMYDASQTLQPRPPVCHV
ncbi:hypothetical protein E2C01_081492 [Portunus trituberculatus]|uniref:Uncharacterized protein n=1 Tax=Portunus trituberculatus TaxID=210409 RepID=A0A5B7IYB7_PORTR|nr:hypothetical protein [Portunus trituberculatus]